MSGADVERIRAELERRELYYGEKQLLAEGRLSEVVIELQKRERALRRFHLPIYVVLVLDIVFMVHVSASPTREVGTLFPDRLLLVLNALLVGIYVVSDLASRRTQRTYSRWLRELEEPGAASAVEPGSGL